MSAIHLFERFRILNDGGGRVVFEVDDTDFGQLREVVQLVADRWLLCAATAAADVFVRMRHFYVGQKKDRQVFFLLLIRSIDD